MNQTCDICGTAEGVIYRQVINLHSNSFYYSCYECLTHQALPIKQAKQVAKICSKPTENLIKLVLESRAWQYYTVFIGGVYLPIIGYIKSPFNPYPIMKDIAQK